ncbi:hypothetical protein GP475_12195 [Corynebacterium poyangense]|uniref:SdpI family protein n=1 Tax=Corynebacterium poyangense TaxID=2684405 RepID=A0A7H0SRY3_9CORY|nr:SdpI family protein [Corynebacterium poyangense]QNQ91308.1 hypothetical protein GP475_12195 [Corynebacterium poyangense]
MNWFLGILFLILGVAQVTFGFLAWKRKLPGNKFFGLRVPEVRKSKEIWDSAHAIAGPVWLCGGLTLLFASVIAFLAYGWLWLLTAATVLIALASLGLGANVGARTAVVMDQDMVDEDSSCCSSPGSSAPASSPKVDLDAVRKAAQAQD